MAFTDPHRPEPGGASRPRMGKVKKGVIYTAAGFLGLAVISSFSQGQRTTSASSATPIAPVTSVVTSTVTTPGPTTTVTVTAAPVTVTVTVPAAPLAAGAAPTGNSAPAAAPDAPASYANCAAVRAAGKAPILRGQPGYGRHLDRDGDGIGCE
jgi:hypothetical protein